MNILKFNECGGLGREVRKSFVSGLFGGGSAEKRAKREAELARKRQEEALAQQDAVTARQRQQADKKEEDLSGTAAAQRRALNARRSSRGGLAFTGANAGSALKTKLGE